MVIFSLLFCTHGIAGQSQGDQQTEERVQQGSALVTSDSSFHVTEEVLANLTPGERIWYHRFQEGIPFFDGWKKITQAVVARFPEQEREKRIVAMQTLGLKIGYEWSRDNRVRKVTTEMLRNWGKELRNAGAKNNVQLAEALYKIDSEMNNLLRLE